MNEKIAIKLQGVKKQYRLGQIGGGTLQGDLQSWWARKRGKEDPNTKIGTDQRLIGKTFMALNGIDLEIPKGQAIGIIGKNGAGKSTMLKLLCRVTAPTEGTIDIYGRIASMLEVGTGFHPEMTGRENVYMNGAILGMTKSEIDSKMAQIIEFSEVGDFIDTPVKRYSSGMYVKLAFSVAAHLDSEIMIMDEVLAVGDMKFQQKCLNKMRDAATLQGKTVLYVSHNMNTIRQLCDRCIVLSEGKIVFDGDVEEAIDQYLGITTTSDSQVDLSAIKRDKWFDNPKVRLTNMIVDTTNSVFKVGDLLDAQIIVESQEDYQNCILKIFILYEERAVTTMETSPVIYLNGKTTIKIRIDLDRIAPATYSMKMVLCQRNELGGVVYLDVIPNCYMFDVIEPENFQDNQKWNVRNNGFFIGKMIQVL